MVSLIAYIIPDVPRKLQQQLRQETILTQEIVLETELKRAKGAGEEVLSDLEMEEIRGRTGTVRGRAKKTSGCTTPDNKGFLQEDP